jgi:hypothetical protein
MRFFFLFFILLFSSLFSVSAQKITQTERDSVKNLLDKMKETDQKYRWQLMFGELNSLKVDSFKSLPDSIRLIRIKLAMNNKIGFSKKIRDSIQSIQNSFDSINKSAFIKIVKQYGFPNYKKFRSETSNWITLHFVSKTDFDTFFTLFETELHKKNMPPKIFASWYDRCQVVIGKKQFYGEYNKTYPCVENLIETNQARIKIGLKRIKINRCM